MQREGHPPLPAWLLSAAVLAAACGGGPSGAGGASKSVAFPPLRAVESGAPRDEARVVHRIEIPAELRNWKARSAEIAVVPGDDGTRRLSIASDERSRVLVPGPLDPRGINRLVLQLDIEEHRQTITVDFVTRGATVASTPAKAVVAGGEPIAFDVPAVGWLEEDIDQVVLNFIGPVTGTLGWIELQHTPQLALLPPPEAPELAVVAGDHRRCVGLSTARPIETELEVKARSTLRFAYATRTPLPRDAPARLVLHLTDEDGVSVRRVVDDGTKPPRSWRGASVPLEELAGQLVMVRFAIESDFPDEVVYALAEPRVVTEGAAPRPHVLLITSDTHRADHVGHARRGVGLSTPAIDALAERGIVFDDCFSSTNVTNPSHIALMTATHPRDTGILTNDTALAAQARTLAEAFRQAGYVGYAIVSTHHLGHGTSGIGQGFDRMSVPGSPREAVYTVDVAERWIRNSGGVPLFVWLHLFDAHTPYDPPGEYVRKYYGDAGRAFDETLPDPEELPRGFWRGSTRTTPA